MNPWFIKNKVFIVPIEGMQLQYIMYQFSAEKFINGPDRKEGRISEIELIRACSIALPMNDQTP